MKDDTMGDGHQPPAGGLDAGASSVSLLPHGEAPASATGGAIAMGGAYEGAARLSREMSSWQAANRSADRDMLPHKDVLDARSKDIVRNDAYVENGVEKYKDSVVGSRFNLNCIPNIAYLSRIDKRFDDKWMEEYQEEVEAKYELAAESSPAWFDAQRRKTATEIIRLGLATRLIQGEVFISSEWISQRRRPFKTAFLMLDPTRIDDPGIVGIDYMKFNQNVRKGVRLNSFGEAVGYFIANEHPHDYYPTFINGMGLKYQYTEKETSFGRQNIFHSYEERRIGQTRGISKLVSALKEMKMTKSFRDVMLQNAIVNATYAATIESELPTAQVLEMMGGSDADPETMQKAISGYTGGFLGSLAEYLTASNGTMLNGVKIPHLFPGTKMHMQPAGQGGPLGTQFETSLLRYLAANLNMSYEQLSGDLSQVNYSTMKGAVNETEKHMKVEKRMTADRIANFMFGNWLEEMLVTGQIDSMPTNAPSFYEGLNREAYCQAEWFNSGRGQIEELKETQAASLRLKSNITSYEDEMSHLGRDWRRVIKQKARENAYAKLHGIDLTFEDNMINAASGAPREKQASEDDGEGPTNE